MRPQLYVGANALARLGEAQALQHGRHPAGLDPLRHQVLQRIAAGGIRIGIAIDFEPARLGLRNHVERARGLAPVVHPRALEMHDLDMHAAVLRHIDRFCERLDHVVGFISQMGEIARVAALEHPA